MQLLKLKCEKCGHQWIPRVENPLKCPKCGHIRGSKIYTKRKEREHGSYHKNREKDGVNDKN